MNSNSLVARPFPSKTSCAFCAMAAGLTWVLTGRVAQVCTTRQDNCSQGMISWLWRQQIFENHTNLLGGPHWESGSSDSRLWHGGRASSPPLATNRARGIPAFPVSDVQQELLRAEIHLRSRLIYKEILL